MIQLTGITWDHPRGYAPLVANPEYNGIHVQWERRSLKDFGDATLADLAQRFDLIVLDHPHCGEAATGILLPLDDLLTAEALESLERPAVGPSFASYRFDRRQWALPVDAATQIAACCPQRLADHELPKTWEEALDFAAQLRSRGMQMGMALCPTDALCSFLTLTAQAGDPPIDNRWIQLDTVFAVLDQLRKLREACHPASLEWNPIALYEHMAGGGPVAYSPLAFGYSHFTRAGDNGRLPLAFGAIPGRTGALLGGAGIGVSAQCRYPDAAATYAAWICGPEMQRTRYVSAGGQPAHGAAWTDSAANAASGGFLRAARPTLETAWVRPRIRGWPAFQEALGDTVHRHLRENISPTKTAGTLTQLHARLMSG